MKIKKRQVLAKSTPTLTQSGLLAVLLQRQRQKVVELTDRRAHRNQSRFTFSNALSWLSERVRGAATGRTFNRSVGQTLPRHL